MDEFLGKESTVIISGYRESRADESPDLDKGNARDLGPHAIEYTVKTEAGKSGCPVWVPCKGLQTVICIQ